MSKQWLKYSLLGLAVLACGFALYLFTRPPVYVASGLIKIESRQPFIAFRCKDDPDESKRYVRTQIAIMRSPVVLRAVLADQRVGSAKHLLKVGDRLAHLQEGIEVEQLDASDLYRVSYAAPSAQEASDVVAAVIQQYFLKQSNEGYRRVQRVVDLLERERARRQREVERLQQHVIDLSREVTGKDPFGYNLITDVDTAFCPLPALRQQLTDIEVRKEIVREEIQLMAEAEVNPTPHADRSGVVGLEVALDSHVRQLEELIAQIGSQVREIQRGHEQESDNENHNQLSEQLEELEAGLADYKAKLRRELLVDHTPEHLRGESRADAKRRELASLEIQERSLRKRFEKELADVQRNGGKAAELEFARVELEREQKVFEMIAARKLVLQTEAKAPARVEVVDEVSVTTDSSRSGWRGFFGQ